MMKPLDATTVTKPNCYFIKKKKKLIRMKFKIYFINLEIIGEEKLYIFLKSKNLKNFCNMVKPLGATTVSKLNCYFIK